jgi:hypothetical protein
LSSAARATRSISTPCRSRTLPRHRVDDQLAALVGQPDTAVRGLLAQDLAAHDRIGCLELGDEARAELRAQARIESVDVARQAIGREHDARAHVEQMAHGMEELELRGLLARVEELDVFEHEQSAAVPVAPLELVGAPCLQRARELVRERLGRGVDHARLALRARFVDDRAREVGLAEALLRRQHERIQCALRPARDRQRRLARQRVARADHEVVEFEAVRQLVLGFGSRRSGLGVARLRHGDHLRNSGSRCAHGGDRVRHRGGQRRCHHEIDRDGQARLGSGAALDVGQEALADAVAVERGRTSQDQPVARSVVLRGVEVASHERADPGFEGERGHFGPESAQDAVPEPRGVRSATFRFVEDCERFTPDSRIFPTGSDAGRE